MAVSRTLRCCELLTPLQRAGQIGLRVIGAVCGGYGLGALTSVAALALPMPTSQAVLAGMLLSFLVYAGAVIWVFMARSAARAWAGLAVAAVPLALAAWSVSAGAGGGHAS